MREREREEREREEERRETEGKESNREIVSFIIPEKTASSVSRYVGNN